MTHIHYEITVDRPAPDVWAILSDFGRVYRYNPTVRGSHLTKGSPPDGPGATRHCDLTFPGASAEERIVEWRDGEGYVLEIFDGQRLPPFKGAPTATLAVRPAGSDRSIVTGDLSYRMKFGPIGWLMDRAMVRPRFGSAFGTVIAGLKHYAETGEEVTAETNLSSVLPALRGEGKGPSGRLAEAR